MDVQATGVPLVEPIGNPPENLKPQEIPTNQFQHDIKPDINLHTDSFEIEHTKEPQTQTLEVDFSRAFPTQLSLEIQNHLEKALRDIIHVSPARQKEREGVLEAEQKIRYKILKEEQPLEFKKGFPIVKPKRVIVRRKKVINPARRIPKYLPTVDGGMWKVWGYPEFIELSTSSSEEVVEIPEGVELDQDGYPLLDPDRFDFTTLSPKWLRVLGKLVLYLLQSVTGFFMVKYAVKLYRCYTRDQFYKHNKPPDLSETSSEDTADQGPS